MGDVHTSTRTETAFPIRLALNRNGELTGATVILEVRDAATNNSYLDFDDGNFKTSGWVDKELAVVEVVAGLYVLAGGVSWDAQTLPAGDYLDLEYTATISGVDWIVIDSVRFDDRVEDLNDPTAAGIADAVWDEILTGATHNINTSAGKRLRQLGETAVAAEGTVVDVSASTTVFETDLTDVDDFWNDTLIVFIDGALTGQSRTIVDFSNTAGTITLDEALTSVPANGVAFLLMARHIHPVSQIADGIWDETAADHVAAGSTGEGLKEIRDHTKGDREIDPIAGGWQEVVRDHVTDAVVERYDLFDETGAAITAVSNPLVANVLIAKRTRV